MSDETPGFDVVYPTMGARVRSQLAVSLGADHTEEGYLKVDRHQRTSVHGLYGIVAVGMAEEEVILRRAQDASARLAIIRPIAAIQPPRARTAMVRQDAVLPDVVCRNTAVSAIVSVMTA